LLDEPCKSWRQIIYEGLVSNKLPLKVADVLHALVAYEPKLFNDKTIFEVRLCRTALSIVVNLLSLA
jgi:hypothetical protein